MEILEKVIYTISNDILFKISNTKLKSKEEKEIFINKYNKINYSKFKVTYMSNNEINYYKKRVLKYKIIYCCIIIQKYIRRYLILKNSVKKFG